jgi:(p)ppGpp synthase/HD superfamily hydrolase
MPAVDAPPFIAELPLTCAAYEYAERHHDEQRRESDLAPFVLHPLEVAVLLRNRDYDDEVVAAGLLHDVVEDTDATIDEVRGRFGDRVASLVQALSDDPSIEDYAERKAALRDQVEAAGDDAQAIYAADKVAKARELRAKAAREGASFDEAKLDHYEKSLAMLEREVPDLPLVRQLRFELWALRTLPPGAPDAQ